MKILFKNANVIDTQKQTIFKSDVLVNNKKIVKVAKNITCKANKTINLKGKWLCPGFIDGHIHIESSKLCPSQLAKALVPHGTTAIIADPHEIANVSGTKGIDYMLEASKNLPMDIFFTIPSCVPATMFDESYEILDAPKIKKYVNLPQVVGLAEVMNYVAVVNNEQWMLDKIKMFKLAGKTIDGHAPGLTGKVLANYVSHGIQSDHECSTCASALEKLKLGQWIMMRNGSACHNLVDLLPIIDKHAHKCMIVDDDKEPLDIINNGHLDESIKLSLKHKKDLLKLISMVTYNPAKYFHLHDLGMIKQGFKASFIIFDNLHKLSIREVYHDGLCVYANKKLVWAKAPKLNKAKYHQIYHSINTKPITLKDLRLDVKGKHKVNVIDTIPGQVITKKVVKTLNFDVNNGIDLKQDVLKIVVIERHKATGHIGIAYIHGFGFKHGALASTVSHDSHNIIAIGSSDRDILLAINKIKQINGGNVVVNNHKVVATLPLPIAGLMSDKDIHKVIADSKKVKLALDHLGVNKKLSPFMNMGFISLPVIPDLKITTNGLVDVTNFKLIDLIKKEH